MTGTYGEFDSKMFDFMSFIQYVIFNFFRKNKKNISGDAGVAHINDVKGGSAT